MPVEKWHGQAAHAEFCRAHGLEGRATGAQPGLLYVVVVG